jgi:hypothetical protein
MFKNLLNWLTNKQADPKPDIIVIDPIPTPDTSASVATVPPDAPAATVIVEQQDDRRVITVDVGDMCPQDVAKAIQDVTTELSPMDTTLVPDIASVNQDAPDTQEIATAGDVSDAPAPTVTEDTTTAPVVTKDKKPRKAKAPKEPTVPKPRKTPKDKAALTSNKE